MKLRIREMALLGIVALLLVTTALACGGKGAGSALDGEALVDERCTKCHDLGRVEAANKSADGWKTTVTRMVGIGAELNEAEQTAVIEYLTAAYPE